jgi:hypothetical protein
MRLLLINPQYPESHQTGVLAPGVSEFLSDQGVAVAVVSIGKAGVGVFAERVTQVLRTMVANSSYKDSVNRVLRGFA